MTSPEPNMLEFTGYFPGVVGKATELHATYYYENWGFDFTFETQVAIELAGFISEFRQDTDVFLVAKVAGQFAGCIAIDGRQADAEGSRLRWFIVAPRFQGSGIGRKLLRQAIKFCNNAGHRRIYLWTFEGLDMARSLYEQEGFVLCEEHHVDQWGKNLTEQMFELRLRT